MEKLNPIFESMDTDIETKYKLQEAFDKAVLVEATKMIDEQLEAKLEEETKRLEEEYEQKVLFLEDAIDSYLDTVVEEFITQNEHSYESELAEEQVKTMLELFDKMVAVAGMDLVEIKEMHSKRVKAKEEALYESTQGRIEELESQLSETVNKLTEAKREAEKYLKTGLIMELSSDLTMIEAEKFQKLAEMVPFSKDKSYYEKLSTIKESIIDARDDSFNEGEIKLPKGAFKKTETPSLAEIMDISKFI